MNTLNERVGTAQKAVNTIYREMSEIIRPLQCEVSIPSRILFPLIDKLSGMSGTQVSVLTGVLSGSWKLLDTGKSDMVISSDRGFKNSSEFNCKWLSKMRHLFDPDDGL